MKIGVPLEEQETVINYSKMGIGEWAEVYTTDNVVMKRYEKFGAKRPEYCKLLKKDNCSATFSVHPKCAGIYPKAPRQTNLTEEQRKELQERMIQLHSKKK